MTNQHHAPEHQAHGDDSYFVDQLCMVAVAGAFGAICLSLWFFVPAMLNRLLAEHLHVYVLVSGIALSIVAVARAWVLWVEAKIGAGQRSHTQHEHGEECGQCPEGSHDHGSAHDHGWAPWRYVVLLVPIVFFLLGLPSTLPTIQAGFTDDFTTIGEAAGFIGVGADRWAWLGQAAVYGSDSSMEPAQEIKFGTLYNSGLKEDSREYWAERLVAVSGKIYPSRNNNSVFHLVRLKVDCLCSRRHTPPRLDALPRKHCPFQGGNLGRCAWPYSVSQSRRVVRPRSQRRIHPGH